MRIKSITPVVVDIPFIRPFMLWRGAIPSKEHVIVRVETDEGLIGWGEAAPFLFYAPETAFDIAHFITTVTAPMLIGRDPRDLVQSRHDLAMLDGHLFAKCAVETACWDILAKSAGLPLHRLLGGPVRDSVPLIPVVHSGSIEEVTEDALSWVSQGFRQLKVKLGFGFENDVALVEAVRSAVGREVILRADAEEHYRPKEALRLCRALEDLDLELLSQPVDRADWAGMAFLRANTIIPILADEGIHSAADVLTAVQSSSADMINIKVLKSGGLLEGSAMAAVAYAAGLPVTIGSMVELGIGSLLGAHLAITLPDLIATELAGPLLLETDLLDRPLAIEGGAIHLSDEPGLGAGIDVDALDNYRVA